jgi:hypothetical protein
MKLSSAFCVIGNNFLKFFNQNMFFKYLDKKFLICALLLCYFLKRNKQLGVSIRRDTIPQSKTGRELCTETFVANLLTQSAAVSYVSRI